MRETSRPPCVHLARDFLKTDVFLFVANKQCKRRPIDLFTFTIHLPTDREGAHCRVSTGSLFRREDGGLTRLQIFIHCNFLVALLHWNYIKSEKGKNTVVRVSAMLDVAGDPPKIGGACDTLMQFCHWSLEGIIEQYNCYQTCFPAADLFCRLE